MIAAPMRIEAYRGIILGAIEEMADLTLTAIIEMLRQEHGARSFRDAISDALTLSPPRNTPATSLRYEAT